MFRGLTIVIFWLFALRYSLAADQSVQELDGISIIGNKELPKSLVIVPWKASLPGEGDFSLQRHIDEYIQPIDKEVFQRKVDFYLQSKN